MYSFQELIIIDMMTNKSERIHISSLFIQKCLSRMKVSFCLLNFEACENQTYNYSGRVFDMSCLVLKDFFRFIYGAL